ncbi:MAG: hypothetical protein ABIQ07_01830 [Ginsengibacter sp.]
MMRNILLFLILPGMLLSCSSRNIPHHYYRNQKSLDSLHSNYRSLINENVFTLFFKDRSYRSITLEIFTDTLKYIYYFKINEASLQDTLMKYKINPENFYFLMDQMTRTRSLWVSQLDYYVGSKKDSLIYIAFRSRPLWFFFTSQKYFMINWFKKPQQYDRKGVLLDLSSSVPMELNDRKSHRINDTMAYRISNRFR